MLAVNRITAAATTPRPTALLPPRGACPAQTGMATARRLVLARAGEDLQPDVYCCVVRCGAWQRGVARLNHCPTTHHS
jgi:hypothetical protein